MALAVPHTAATQQKMLLSSSGFGVKGQNSQYWDEDSENSGSSSRELENDNDSDETNNAQMSDWVKTLEEFDMGSGSEMLRQIGLSLRQRSVMSLDRKTHPESIAAAIQARSKSTCRVEDLGSKTIDGMKNSTVSDNKFNGLITSSVETTNVPKVSNQEENKTKSCGALYSKLAASSAAASGNAKTSPSQSSKSKSQNCNRSKHDQIQTVFTPHPVQLQRVVLEKSWPAEDFGFSISDGLYDRGVYVSAVKNGSLAEKAGLRSLDRILQVDKIKTREFDCRLTVPLIGGAGKQLSLIVCRNPLLPRSSNTMQTNEKHLSGRGKSVKTKGPSDRISGLS
uniref:PDZ domain-containing protein n=1 Tax=Arion vulgaris TaxID=1028688 RepID=A0A0B6Y5Z7_9EUPU